VTSVGKLPKLLKYVDSGHLEDISRLFSRHEGIWSCFSPVHWISVI